MTAFNNPMAVLTSENFPNVPADILDRARMISPETLFPGSVIRVHVLCEHHSQHDTFMNREDLVLHNGRVLYIPD